MDFYEFYEGLQEGWDGPALLVFSDGRRIGARLDRNGLRPARFWRTADDTIYVASEVGVLGDEITNASNVVAKGRLGPGQMVLADIVDGKFAGEGGRGCARHGALCVEAGRGGGCCGSCSCSRPCACRPHGKFYILPGAQAWLCRLLSLKFTCPASACCRERRHQQGRCHQAALQGVAGPEPAPPGGDQPCQLRQRGSHGHGSHAAPAGGQRHGR